MLPSSTVNYLSSRPTRPAAELRALFPPAAPACAFALLENHNNEEETTTQVLTNKISPLFPRRPLLRAQGQHHRPSFSSFFSFPDVIMREAEVVGHHSDAGTRQLLLVGRDAADRSE